MLGQSHKPPDAQGAATELLKRRGARRDLIAFTEYTYEDYQTARPHREIAENLERVERGEVDRLMLLVPPRHGKSELASKRFPAWTLGRNPGQQIISVSATRELAVDFGRDVRNIIQSPEYKAVFPDTTLAEDSKAKGKWHTGHDGVYYTAGIGGSLLGRGADLLLIDDPYSSMAEAQSQLTRKNVWDWYQGTAYNRLQSKGAIVIISHRMHEDDLCGALLQQQAADGDRWEVVELPALTEKQALWPEKYPLEELERIKANIPPTVWSALYQQRPAPEEGEYFKNEWFRWYDWGEKPQHLNIYGASDYAVTGGGGDYTVHIVVGLDADDNLYVLDLWRAQTESDSWIEAFLDLVAQHKPLIWVEEKGQIIKALGPYITKRSNERKVYCHRRQIASVHDKVTRSRAIQARASMGKLYLPKGAPWVSDLLTELLTFPQGRHDDQVDALGLIGGILDKMVGGQRASTEKGPVDRWRRTFGEGSAGTNWKTV